MPYYSRYRERNNQGYCPPYTVQYGNGPETLYNAEVSERGTFEYMHDNVSPNWRLSRQRGEIVINDMTRNTIDWVNTCEPIEILDPEVCLDPIVWRGDHARRLERTIPSLGNSSNQTTSNVGSNALVKAYSNMNQADIMGGETLKDLGSTLGMLRKPFSTASDLLVRMAKQRNRRAGKTTQSFMKASANTWLEYRYGWRPLIADTRKAIKLASSARDNKVLGGHHVARGFDEYTRKFPFTNQSWLYDGWLTVNLSGATLDTITDRGNAGVIFALREPSSEAERWARSLGLTAKDIPATVWECVPFSFVIDWFVDVGDWLQAVTPNPFVTVLGSWSTVERTAHRETGGDWSYTLRNNSKTLTGKISNRFLTSKVITRTANPLIPSYPVLKEKLLSVHQLVDALSLSNQKIVSGLKGFKH